MLKQLLLASRPISWVNTAYPFAVAYVIGAGEIDGAWLIGTLYFLVPYNLAMYGINDVFDYESDLRNPRKGGVEGAVLDRRFHRVTLTAVVVTNVPFLLALLVYGSPLSWLVLAVSVFAVIAYSAPGLRYKERPFIDSMTSSTHFVSPAVYGLALAGGEFTPEAWAIFGAFFLWGMASHAFGAVQDVVADREAGIGSVATVIGARRTVRLSVLLYVAAGVLLFWGGDFAMLGAILVVPYVLNVWRFRNIDDVEAEDANVGWKSFLWVNYVVGFFVTMLVLWALLV